MNYVVVSTKYKSAIIYPKSSSTIFRQGDRAGLLYLVKSGCVVLSCVTRSGYRQVAGFVFPGEIFGWEASADHQYCATSAGCSSVQMFHGSQAEDLRRTNLEASFALLRDELLIVSRPSAEARVAAFLDNLLLRQGSARRIYLPMHRFEIAEYLGLSPETVSRVLHRFMKKALIEMPSLQMITVVDRALLKKTSGLDRD